MATRDDVLDAIHRIERAGGAVDGQLGRAAQAMKDAETALAHQLSATAEFDRQIVEALRHAHKTTLEGRRRLDSLEGEIVGAARSWDLRTAAGAREFQWFLIAKLDEIIHVVDDANDDDTSKQALATALTALYAAQTGRDDPTLSPDPAHDPAAVPAEPESDAVTDPDGELLLEPVAEDEPAGGYRAQRPTEIPGMPAVPSFGGEGPGFGAIPTAMPAGTPPTALLSGLHRGDIPGEEEYPPDDATSADDTAPDDTAGQEPDGDPVPDAPHDDGPRTVTLPDGSTTVVADPQLAAAMQSAADGTPVADAFRRQGIAIPPPGTPVTAPVDPTRLRPGDIGVFADRHALAVGAGKALLDGQIHHVANLRGPGFLGWQHPSIRIGEPTPDAEPAPTRPATALVGLKIPVPTVIVD